MFSEMLGRNSSGMHSQTISNAAENTSQSQIASRQILAESLMISTLRPQLESRPVMNEELQPIPVRISNGSRGSHGSSNPSIPLHVLQQELIIRARISLHQHAVKRKSCFWATRLLAE